ncbi:hypothetical protein AB0C74_20210 [Spirillospora sp. NPDC048832]
MGLPAHPRQRACHRFGTRHQCGPPDAGRGDPPPAQPDDYGIIIAVWDADHALPEAKPPTELTLEDLDLSAEAFDDNGGWGLHIVQALSARCGVTADPAGGKWVWSRMHP